MAGPVSMQAGRTNAMFKFELNAIGTSWEIDTHRPLTASLREAIHARPKSVIAAYSTDGSLASPGQPGGR